MAAAPEPGPSFGDLLADGEGAEAGAEAAAGQAADAAAAMPPSQESAVAGGASAPSGPAKAPWWNFAGLSDESMPTEPSEAGAPPPDVPDEKAGQQQPVASPSPLEGAAPPADPEAAAVSSPPGPVDHAKAAPADPSAQDIAEPPADPAGEGAAPQDGDAAEGVLPMEALAGAASPPAAADTVTGAGRGTPDAAPPPPAMSLRGGSRPAPDALPPSPGSDDGPAADPDDLPAMLPRAATPNAATPGTSGAGGERPGGELRPASAQSAPAQTAPAQTAPSQSAPAQPAPAQPNPGQAAAPAEGAVEPVDRGMAHSGGVAPPSGGAAASAPSPTGIGFMPAGPAAAPATAAAPAAPPAPPQPAVPVEALAVHIATRARDGARRFDIRLDPPELGRIDVRIDFARDGQMVARLVVERAETLDLLRRDAAGLERALDQAGLRTDQGNLQFSLRDQSGGRHPPERPEPPPPPDLLIVPDDDVAVREAVRRGYSALRGLGRGIDIRI